MYLKKCQKKKSRNVSSPIGSLFADRSRSLGVGIFVIGSGVITRFFLARPSFAFIRMFVPLLFSLYG